eukprot:SAG31_NODE_17814_length_657_cov_0.587814_2_plen_61_part_01
MHAMRVGASVCTSVCPSRAHGSPRRDVPIDPLRKFLVVDHHWSSLLKMLLSTHPHANTPNS